MHDVSLRQVGSGPQRVPHVEMLLHALVTNLFILVIRVEEAVLRLRILDDAQVRYRILLVVIVMAGGRCLSLAFYEGEIGLLAEPHSYFVGRIIDSWFSLEILARDHLLDEGHTRRLVEAILAANRELYVLELLVVSLRRVVRRRRRRPSLEIYCSPWEPSQLCSRLEAPVRIILLPSNVKPLSGQIGQVVVSSPGGVEVRAHGLEELLRIL